MAGIPDAGEHDRTAYLIVFAAVLLQLVVLELQPPAAVQQSANVVFAGVFAYGALRMGSGRGLAGAVLVMGAAPSLLELVLPFGSSPGLDVAKTLVWAGGPLLLAGILIRHLLRSPRVHVYEIWGAIALYMLLGVGIADLHELVWILDPGAYVFQNLSGEDPGFSEFLYFSFVTLGTVGYGDVAPVSRPARLLSMVEALAGLMYVAVVVARVVSLHTSGAPREGAAAGRSVSGSPRSPRPDGGR